MNKYTLAKHKTLTELCVKQEQRVRELEAGLALIHSNGGICCGDPDSGMGNGCPICIAEKALNNPETIIDEIGRRASQAIQAKLDSVMLEYCPDEMTKKQMAEWGKRQKRSKPFKAILDEDASAPLDDLFNRDSE